MYCLFSLPNVVFHFSSCITFTGACFLLIFSTKSKYYTHILKCLNILKSVRDCCSFEELSVDESCISICSLGLQVHCSCLRDLNFLLLLFFQTLYFVGFGSDNLILEGKTY